MVFTTHTKMPVYFVRNQGQLEHEHLFYYCKDRCCDVYFTDEGASFVFLDNKHQENPSSIKEVFEVPKKERKGYRLDFCFLNGGRKITPVGRGELEGKVNYFRGSDSNNWNTVISTYTEVVYKDVWSGIDLVFRGEEGRIKYEFIIQPGANVEKIRFTYDGADKLSLDPKGNIIINTPYGSIKDERPVSFQEHQEELVHIESAFQMIEKGKGVCEIKVLLKEGYDHRSLLIIDPGLVYSTFLGGSSGSRGAGIAVDGTGNAYISGSTNSNDFPTTVGAFDTTYNGGVDAFVTKLNPDGNALVYSTYLGGTGLDRATSIAVDDLGNAYVTGQTQSSDFPTTPGTFDPTFNGFVDAFVAKLNSDGTMLLYSTYLGGTSSDTGLGIALDKDYFAYITGVTESNNFPTTAGAFDPTFNGNGEAFVTKLNSVGTALIYSTYLGGTNGDQGRAITVDTEGNAYITGGTFSNNFPTTAGAFDPIYKGNGDAFLTKLNSVGTNLIYSTYLGGTSLDFANGITVDYAGNAYVTGQTQSSDFPTTSGVFDPAFNGNGDAFVTKLNSDGTSLIYSTYLGGTSEDNGTKIAIDIMGNTYITGTTFSNDFPTTIDALDPTYNGNGDAFVTKLNSDGTSLIYSTYLGGISVEQNPAIAIDNTGNAYITGNTFSNDFQPRPELIIQPIMALEIPL